MAEQLHGNPENESLKLDTLIEEYFCEDAEFFAGLDEDDKLGAIYGQLLDVGENPDSIFEQYGLSEEEER